MSKRLLMWVLLGIPVYAINYGLFLVVFWILGSSALAYWSWPLAAPLTLRMWDYLDQRTKASHDSVQPVSCRPRLLEDRI